MAIPIRNGVAPYKHPKSDWLNLGQGIGIRFLEKLESQKGAFECQNRQDKWARLTRQIELGSLRKSLKKLNGRLSQKNIDSEYLNQTLKAISQINQQISSLETANRT